MNGIRRLALVVKSRYLKYAFVLALLPTETMALPLFESGICTHAVGFEQADQVKKPKTAGPNALQDARDALIDRLGKPAIEHHRPDGGTTLTWIAKDGSASVAQNVIIEIVQGDLHVTCGVTF
jgi:hypothetical protein